MNTKIKKPAFYSKSKRGILAAWTEVAAMFTPETRAHDILVILEARKIRTHYYCMMD